MPETIIANCEQKMEKAIDGLNNELAQLRTGRANPSIINGINVSYYGSEMPINQLAQIAVPEAQLLTIKPFDRGILKDIEKAIQLADLNLTPQNDGTMIRIAFPALTEQTRKDNVKKAHSIGESLKVSMRNIRRDAMEELKSLEKESLITEDDLKKYSDDVQKLTDKYVSKIDTLVKEKEQSIMKL